MTFNDIIQKAGTHSIRELDTTFAGLQPVAIDELIGEWRVGYLFTEGTGSKWESLIKYFPIKLYSKKFVDRDNVKAWIFRILGIKFGVLLTSAVLRMVNFRDKVSASMIYNYLPMIDNFRKADEKTIMGIMEVKGKVSVYFYLTRI